MNQGHTLYQQRLWTWRSRPTVVVNWSFFWDLQLTQWSLGIGPPIFYYKRGTSFLYIWTNALVFTLTFRWQLTTPVCLSSWDQFGSVVATSIHSIHEYHLSHVEHIYYLPLMYLQSLLIYIPSNYFLLGATYVLGIHSSWVLVAADGWSWNS